MLTNEMENTNEGSKLTDSASFSASFLTLSLDPVVVAINANLVVFVSTHQEPVMA